MWVPGGFSRGRRATPGLVEGPTVKGNTGEGLLRRLGSQGVRASGVIRVRAAGSGTKKTSSQRTYKWAGSASSPERPAEAVTHTSGLVPAG